MISDEAKNLFEQLNSGKLEVTDWREYCNSIKLTDKALLQFLMDDSIKEKNIKTFEKQLKESQNSVSSFSSFTQKATSALAGFGAIFASVGTRMAAGELINLAINTIHNLATEMSQTEEKANGFSQSISAFGTKVSSGQKNIDNLASQYEALSSGVDNTGHSISLSEEKYNEYKNVIQQLSELMPNLSTIFNEQGEAIGFAGGKIDDVKKKYLEYIQLQSQKYLSDGDEDGNTYQDVLDNYHNKTEKTENTWAGIGRGVLDGVVEAITLGGMTSHDWGYDTSAELTTEGKIEALERFIELTDQLNQKK